MIILSLDVGSIQISVLVMDNDKSLRYKPNQTVDSVFQVKIKDQLIILTLG